MERNHIVHFERVVDTNIIVDKISLPLRLPTMAMRHKLVEVLEENNQDNVRFDDQNAIERRRLVEKSGEDSDLVKTFDKRLPELVYDQLFNGSLRVVDAIVDRSSMTDDEIATFESDEFRQNASVEDLTAVITSFRGKLQGR